MSRDDAHRSRNHFNIGTLNGSIYLMGQRQPSRSHQEWLLLQAVKQDVNARLSQSLYRNLIIPLEKKAISQQVRDRTWSIKTPVADLFDQPEIAGKVLILGHPGMGKTTTLLELAQTLIQKAETDVDDPIPVLCSLNAWQRGQSISRWLIAEINTRYGIRKAIIKTWLNEKKLVPLLDGLDGLKPADQERCVQTINRWLTTDHRPLRFVVCCRSEDYRHLKTKLQIDGGIRLELQIALSKDQLQNYFIQLGYGQLWFQISNDSAIVQNLEIPRLLNSFIWAYQQKVTDLRKQMTDAQSEELTTDAWEQATAQITIARDDLANAYMEFASYGGMDHEAIQRKLYGKCKPPNQAQTRQWIRNLAKGLHHQALSDSSPEPHLPSHAQFLIEQLQPSLLPPRSRKLYVGLVRLVVGSVDGLTMGLLAGAIAWIAFGLDVGWRIGLITAVMIGVAVAWRMRSLDGITTDLVRVWQISLARRLQLLINRLAYGILVGLLVGILAGLVLAFFPAGQFGLTSGLGQGVGVGLAAGGWLGLLAGCIPDVTLASGVKVGSTANAGIWRAAQQALQALAGGLLGGLGLGVGSGFLAIGGLHLSQSWWSWLIGGFVFGFSAGVYAAQPFGVTAIEHGILRVLLYCGGHGPWNYARFLDYLTEHLVLQRIGGRYRFVHRFLEDLCAHLDSH
jgi:DNA polymerase III delta prime subunit